jgi:pyrimidine operon attenuation protein/uracil phosphoribosyltransferase
MDADPVSRQVMKTQEVAQALSRIAHEILEHHGDAEGLVVVGLATGGAHLAKRLADLVNDLEGIRPPCGTLDVTFYRDDFRTRAKPPAIATDITFSIDDRDVLLVDDVFYTGRTTRAALNALMEYGRARTVQLAVLIDRGHRELPINPDYVGRKVATKYDDEVKVLLKESDSEDLVTVEEVQQER